jgi:hypothetical protein
MLKTVGFPSIRTGDQTITNGNLVIGTAGKGIDFSADPAAAGMTSELFDDYEEGTFNPTVVGSTSGGTANYLFGTTARYTKIGRVVYVEIWLAWDTGTGTGNLLIGGLPYSQGGGVPNPGISIGYLNNFASGWTAGATPCGIVVGSEIQLRQMLTGGIGTTSIPYSVSGDMFLSAFYSV